MKMTAPQMTCHVVSGLAKSSCGMPAAIATEGSNSRAAISAERRIARGLDEQDDEGDDQRVERHRFRQREPENGEAEHVVARGRIARDAVHQGREDVPDTDAHASQRDDGETCTKLLGGGEIHYQCS